MAPSVCGRQKPTSVLPQMVVGENVLEEIDVKDVKMTTSIDEQGVTRQYCVTWSDVDSKGAESKKKTSGEEEAGGVVALKKSTSLAKVQEAAKTGKIQCDGPCGAMVDFESVTQFGCDHVICDKCRRSQKSAALFDGSPGCCNTDCIEKATSDGEKLRSGRRLDSMASSVSLRSNDGPLEMIFVHVCILKRLAGHVYRTQLDYEFPSQSRVAELTKTLEPYHSSIKGGASYYSMRKPRNLEDLQPISLVDTNLRFYHLPEYKPHHTGKLYMLIVGANVQLY